MQTPFISACVFGCLIARLHIPTLDAAPLNQNQVWLANAKTNACVVVYPRDCALSARTATKLADYIKEHSGVVVPVITDDKIPPTAQTKTTVLIDGTADHRLASKFGQSIRFSSERSDAYQIKVLPRATSPDLIILAGKSPDGAKYAAYRLMRELIIKDGTAAIQTMDVSAEPFIKTRSVALFNVWGMPIALTRRHNMESWPIEEAEHCLDMYDFFGFNAIESHDRFNDNYLEPLFGLKREQWRQTVQQMADYAHTNGQEFFLRIWGHVVMNTPKLDRLGPNSSVPKKLAYLCVNDPDERARWENDILHYYVNHYAGRIDHLIGHWCDPGICQRNGCDFTTPMKLQMELHRAFKTKDPEFTSSFSLWFFERTRNRTNAWARGGWKGFEDDLDLINAGILDKEVLIATMSTRTNGYRDDEVRAIMDSGHKPCLWTWYRADDEIRPSLHIHLHERLGEYFRTLPASARQLEWHNIERNVHKAANTANFYVAGRLMWEPSLNVDDLLKEFVTFAFGPNNADNVIPAYQAIENLRCHSCALNWEGVRSTGTGTDDPQADLKTAQTALSALSKVAFSPAFRPRIPLDVSPAEMVADLTASLEVIRDYAHFRAVEKPALQKAVQRGDATTAAKLLDQIETRYEPWNLTLAGKQEWLHVRQEINNARRQLGKKSGK